jgi:uncharacterized protein YcbK (DUF882 family)
MLWTINDRTKLTDNFRVDEFACRCGCVAPKAVRDNITALAKTLQAIRSHVKRPIQVNSGYRCVARNALVGGAAKSQHLTGSAVDLVIAGYTGEKAAELFEELIKAGTIPEGGLGVYKDRPSIVHYDLRGRRARW